ncbi:hypothetical protein GOP47_0006523 [Adiantum capillus-veneris]|uniref:Uncharacterized protein n=1 Tax=Adiantum capillus-veneris TaxID=13818 RepID=A0A9D4V4K3_ADICA|nr:hypothetical protein GOP47_0006523 [Adiantum capillus-veneris]
MLSHEVSNDETLWTWCLDCVDIFSSTFMEWEPLEVLFGNFEAHHFDFGSLLYSRCTALEHAKWSIFFFDAEYVVPTTWNDYGTLKTLSFTNTHGW